MSNVKKRNTCVLYLTATCNLKCTYCYIDKSPVLQKIDDMLVETYKTDYFYNFMIKVFPDPKQLESIEFWGGEPSYGLVRAINTVEKALNYYHNLNEFMMSTNLTTETWLDDFTGFLRLFKKYPERRIRFDLQLSLDGPTYINDANRGQGVTEKFTKNFSKLIFNVDKILEEIPNLSIHAHFKPTLDNSSIHSLQNKEDIKNYFLFFETYKAMADDVIHNPRWNLYLPLPNTAVPTPHTTQDGKLFANLCKLAYELSVENEEKHYFKYFNNIVPFSTRNLHPLYCMNEGCGTCGTGSAVVGLLPNNLISVCHNGFVDLLSEYKEKAKKNADSGIHSIDNNLFVEKDVNNQIAYTLEEYENKYEHIVNCYHGEALFQTTEVASYIQMLANIGQVDKQYSEPKKAVEAAHFIFQSTSSCLRDNLGATGSRYLLHPGLIKLMLNGAKEYIENANKKFSTRTR